MKLDEIFVRITLASWVVVACIGIICIWQGHDTTTTFFTGVGWCLPPVSIWVVAHTLDQTLKNYRKTMIIACTAVVTLAWIVGWSQLHLLTPSLAVIGIAVATTIIIWHLPNLAHFSYWRWVEYQRSR